MPLDERLMVVLDFLRPLNKYRLVIDRIESSNPLDAAFVFEALFAYALEHHGISPDYEVNINPDNNSTVDFSLPEHNGSRLCFELVSPNMSDELTREAAPRMTDVEGVFVYGAVLDSNHPNPHMRPEAQTIRMQEKLLDKMEKFPPPTEEIFPTIVVNCKAFHFGQYDEDDCRMVMFGRTRNPGFQEHWEGADLMGLMDENNDRHGASELRERIAAVIFIPEVSPDTADNVLENAFIVLNPLRPSEYRNAFWAAIRDNDALRHLQ